MACDPIEFRDRYTLIVIRFQASLDKTTEYLRVMASFEALPQKFSNFIRIEVLIDQAHELIDRDAKGPDITVRAKRCLRFRYCRRILRIPRLRQSWRWPLRRPSLPSSSVSISLYLLSK